MNYTQRLTDYLEMEKRVLTELDLEAVNELMNVMERARLDGKRIFICGNGGSAATASHFVCDFTKGVSLHQAVKYDFECLSDNTPLFSAIANDIGYDEVYELPLRAKLRQGDVVIGISGSGNSENVVRALRYANEHGGVSVAIVGYGGGRMLELAQHAVHVKIDNMQIVEDVHMILDHMMMYVLANAGEEPCP